MTVATKEAWAVRVGRLVIAFGLGVTVGAAIETMDPGPQTVRTYSVDCPTKASCEPVWVDGRWQIQETGP